MRIYKVTRKQYENNTRVILSVHDDFTGFSCIVREYMIYDNGKVFINVALGRYDISIYGKYIGTKGV